ncbi:histidine kinase [Mycoplasmatota bacterium]|nr:histidine kinase [Mycoplasmatota bacterium]
MKVFKLTIFIISILILISYLIGGLNLFYTVFFLVMVLINYIFVFNYYIKMKQEYKKMNQTLENIINESLDARMVSKYVSYRELNANLNRLAKKIEKMRFKKAEDELTIKILTNNITSPIIYIDRDGRIRYVNNQFLNCFDVNVEINDIYEKMRIKKLYQFIDDAFIYETKEMNTILIREKYYHANAIPINNHTNNHFSFVGILFIFHDITELKRYERLQREFLADASHELKTPLSAIKGASEILLNGEKHSLDTTKEFLTIIKNENDRMERIVRDILLISRIENERVLIHTEKIDLNKLINEVIDLLRFKLNRKKQELQLDLNNHLNVYGDYERLKHAFLNLLSNASSYTDEHKSIFIKTYQDSKHVIVSIKDQGIGIAEDALPHIFERFYRVDKARSRETGGTGLGLAIVKSTLDIHKAKIEVKSKLNEGSEFIIYFNK